MAKLKGIQTNKQILSFYTLVYSPNATQRSLPLPFQEQNTHTYVYLQEIPEDDTSHRPYPKKPQNRSEGSPLNLFSLLLRHMGAHAWTSINTNSHGY